MLKNSIAQKAQFERSKESIIQIKNEKLRQATNLFNFGLFLF